MSDTKDEPHVLEETVLVGVDDAVRRMSEDALGLVEAILSSAPFGIAVLDLDLCYLRVNAAYAEISGRPIEDHQGGRLGDVVPLPPQVGADLRRVVTTGRTILNRPVEIADRGAVGALRHFDASYYPVRSAAGTLIAAGITVVEVTDAKRAEAARGVLLARAEAAQQRLAILATASTVLAGSMDVDHLLGRLARMLTPGVADWCIIEALGDAGVVEHVAVAHRDRAAADELGRFLLANPIASSAGGPIAAVLRSGEARLFGPDAVGEAMHEAASDRGRPEMAGDFAVQASVIVPIKMRNEVLGVLVLSTDGERLLDDDDLDLAVEVAHRAGLALGNARAFRQEHRIAESLQRSLLPDVGETCAGVELSVRYLAATDGASVGGDWYDAIPLPGGRLGLVVGDVVGHDLAATSAMGQLRSTLRAFVYEDHASPLGPLARLDRLVEPLGMAHATCVLAILDPVTGRLQWSAAGHPPPLLVRAGEARYLEGGGGALLGLAAGTHVHEAEERLEPGDFVVLFTDGLIERRRESIVDGLARLRGTAAKIGASSADELCAELVRSLLPEGVARDDDVALLVVRVLDPAG